MPSQNRGWEESAEVNKQAGFFRSDQKPAAAVGLGAPYIQPPSELGLCWQASPAPGAALLSLQRCSALTAFH